MALLGIDIGGTKIAFALFRNSGEIMDKNVITIDGRTGSDVGTLITVTAAGLLNEAEAMSNPVQAIGVSVPGISRQVSGTVWAPNIPGWEDYPLMKEIRSLAPSVPVIIESDRACYISAEVWKGNARGCSNAIFIAVGTGIGAGIIINGEILRGANDIAGATGWMALNRPFDSRYARCGCFEYYASGEGIALQAEELLKETKEYGGELKSIMPGKITAHDVFKAWRNGDSIAVMVIRQAVEYWGMAAANFVSLFNPEKIIFGGGVFGPAKEFIPAIMTEAEKWAQPISIKKVSFEASALAGDAGVYGAGYLAMKKLNQINSSTK
jgi:glucokinase